MRNNHNVKSVLIIMSRLFLRLDDYLRQNPPIIHQFRQLLHLSSKSDSKSISANRKNLKREEPSRVLLSESRAARGRSTTRQRTVGWSFQLPSEIHSDWDPDTRKRFPTVTAMREKKLRDWAAATEHLPLMHHIACRDFLLEPRFPIPYS